MRNYNTIQEEVPDTNVAASSTVKSSWKNGDHRLIAALRPALVTPYIDCTIFYNPRSLVLSASSTIRNIKTNIYYQLTAQVNLNNNFFFFYIFGRFQVRNATAVVTVVFEVFPQWEQCYYEQR